MPHVIHAKIVGLRSRHDVPVVTLADKEMEKRERKRAEYRGSAAGIVERRTKIVGRQLLSDIKESARVPEKSADSHIVDPVHCRQVISLGSQC